MDPRVAKARERLLNDFEFYAAKCLQIRTKDGEIKPLVLKPAQKLLLKEMLRQIAERGYVRALILKARQQGLSTVVEAFLYFVCSQRKGRKGLVLAHLAESAEALFGMTQRYHDNCPEAVKPSTKYSSRRELFFDKLDSQITVGTAGGKSIARGETNTFVHASEFAFWSKTTAADTWNGIRQSVADKPGTFILIESTANGVSGAFYDMCQGAMKGENDYSLVFIPWFLDPDYARSAPQDFVRTPDEDKIASLALKDWQIAITDGQLYWRRLMIGEVGREKFQQEYPATPDEAFLASGRPVFDAEVVAAKLTEVRKDKKPVRKALSPAGKFEPDSRGELLVYEEPKAVGSYVVGADVSKGIKGCDYSVAQVLSSEGKLVATWRGHVLPDYFASILERLGQDYNMAELIVENNDHGVLTCHYLQQILNYPYLYLSTTVDKRTNEETEVVGFSTNARTKPLVIDKLRSAVRKGEIDVRDLQTLREMQTYIVTEGGKMEAEPGCHDDTVMALALAHHGIGSLAPPVKLDDSWYTDAF